MSTRLATAETAGLSEKRSRRGGRRPRRQVRKLALRPGRRHDVRPDGAKRHSG